jgi:2-C-methyl-D-erythritol 2,4-cyclodiphosphate synthase
VTVVATNKLRIGTGYDVHALVLGRPLILGGVTIPHEKGLDGHSDADVLAHALADALLGAARLPDAQDIGQLFPDTDPSYKGADSLGLLTEIATRLADANFRLIDADCVIMAQEPKLSPYRAEMRERLAAALNITSETIGVKATTTEHLGFVGRSEGIAAQAVVLLERLDALPPSHPGRRQQ